MDAFPGKMGSCKSNPDWKQNGKTLVNILTLFRPHEANQVISLFIWKQCNERTYHFFKAWWATFKIWALPLSLLGCALCIKCSQIWVWDTDQWHRNIRKIRKECVFLMPQQLGPLFWILSSSGPSAVGSQAPKHLVYSVAHVT